EAKVAEAEREHALRELRGVATAAVRGHNAKAKARDRGMRTPERNTADHAAVALQPRKIVIAAPPIAVAAVLQVVGDPLRDVGEFLRLDRLITPLRRRVLPRGFDRRCILRRELAQDQTLGFKLRQHRGTDGPVGLRRYWVAAGQRRVQAGTRAYLSKAGGFAECRVDAVLPARAVFLEEIEHVAVDAQRHHLLYARDRLRFRQGVCDLGGRLLERRLGGVPGV